jgi:hypothetical protein
MTVRSRPSPVPRRSWGRGWKLARRARSPRPRPRPVRLRLPLVATGFEVLPVGAVATWFRGRHRARPTRHRVPNQEEPYAAIRRPRSGTKPGEWGNRAEVREPGNREEAAVGSREEAAVGNPDLAPDSREEAAVGRRNEAAVGRRNEAAVGNRAGFGADTTAEPASRSLAEPASRSLADPASRSLADPASRSLAEPAAAGPEAPVVGNRVTTQARLPEGPPGGRPSRVANRGPSSPLDRYNL